MSVPRFTPTPSPAVPLRPHLPAYLLLAGTQRLRLVDDAFRSAADLRMLGARALASGIEHPIGWRDTGLAETAVQHGA